MSFWKRKRSGNNSGHSGLSLQDDMDFIAQSGGFDAEYYRRQYPEVTGSDRDLLLEYFERGWQQRNPNTWFDTKFYLSVNHDVAEANINPLLHYLRHGKSEGRSCMPGEVGALSPESQKPKSAEPEPGPSDNGGEAIKDLLNYVRTTGAFDERYYATRYPDVPAAKVDPLQHYMRAGWREGRDPNQWFETAYYLASNPDVQATGMNPFVHFLRAGKSEGRRPARKNVDCRRALDNLVDFEKHYEQYPDRQVPPVGVGTILEAIRQNLVHERFVIALSHDNYVEVVGGVQICVRDEQKAFQDAGHDYIQLFPYNPKPSLAKEPLNRFSVGLNVNGNFIGNFRCTNVLLSLKELMRDSAEAIPCIVIHHLMGFSLSFVGELLDLMRPQQIFFWIHDFFTVCPMPSLLRNGVVFCNAPATGSNSCTVCSYGDERKRLTQEVKSFFEKYDIHVIAHQSSRWTFGGKNQPSNTPLRKSGPIASSWQRRKAQERPCVVLGVPRA